MSTQPTIAEALPLTAFGDLRTAEISPVYQISFEYSVTNTEIGKIEVAGSGAVTQADAMVVATTGTTTASDAEWKTTHNVKYKAGMGGLMRFTALFTPGVAGTEQMVGLADEDGSSASHKNGYAVGYNGSVFSFMRWQNDVLFPIAQSAWDDPLDGTGPSGMTLDHTKLNVFEIRFQYLGAGTIQLLVEDDSTGKFINAHTLLYANLNTVPSSYMPNFHLMVHVLNGGTTSSLTAKSASMAFFVEGKSTPTHKQQPHFSSSEQQGTGITTEVAIFTIRNKSLYASKPNFIDILLEDVAGSIEAGAANNLGSFRLVKNATLGGTPSWADVNTTDSIVEIDTAGTTVTGGTPLHYFPVAGKNGLITDGTVIEHEFVISPGDTITVAGKSVASATMNAALLWSELF